MDVLLISKLYRSFEIVTDPAVRLEQFGVGVNVGVGV